MATPEPEPFSEPLTPLISPHPSSSRQKEPKPVFEVGDHVFVAPPYDERCGEPYLIARIQEFVAADRVRVAFFLRPRDTGGRSAQHGRRLLASFHSDVVPRNFLRSKCHVIHKDRMLEGEAALKKKPDCFYYNQLYDRYLHRYFDVIPTREMRNAPEQILDYLQSSFEYIVCESSFTADICNERQTCATCTKWTTPADSIVCDICRQTFHMACLDPPLKKKPKLGFSFSCGPCTLKRDEEMEAYYNGERTTPPPTSAVRVTDHDPRKGKRKGKARDHLAHANASHVAESVKVTNGWPFRYFGAAISPSDVLDPHQAYTPRAASRIGARYQVLVPDDVSEPIPSTSKIKCAPLPHARGSESAIEVIAKPNDSVARNDYMDTVKKMPLFEKVGVPLLDKALQLWQAKRADAPENVRKLKLADLKRSEWTEDDMQKIDDGLQEWEEELDEIAKTLPGKKIGEVVDFVYTKRPFSHIARDEGRVSDKYASSGPTLGLGHEDDHPTQDEDLEDESIAGSPPPNQLRLGPCAVCETVVASHWFKCPSNVGEGSSTREKQLCPECSFQWRHYANDTVIVPEVETKGKVGRPRKQKPATVVRADESGTDEESLRTPTPEPPPKIILPPKPCVMCKRMEPKMSLAQCQNCTMSAHVACYGIDTKVDLEDWLCDLCSLQQKAKKDFRPKFPEFAGENALRLRKPFTPPDPRCCLCPEMILLPDQADKAPLTALDALKITEGNAMVHLICALWHKNITFTDPNLFRLVEGVVSVDLACRLKQCSICGQSNVGACVQCADCDSCFHVSCAWASNYKFGFEFSPHIVKRNIKEPEPIIFKESYGVMNAKVWCSAHKLAANGPVYDLGEKDQLLKLTALQVYANHYKAEPSLEIPSNVRRGRKIDALLRPALYKDPPPMPPPPLPKAKQMPQPKNAKGSAKANGPNSKAKPKGKSNAKTKGKGKTKGKEPPPAAVEQPLIVVPGAKKGKAASATVAKPKKRPSSAASTSRTTAYTPLFNEYSMAAFEVSERPTKRRRRDATPSEASFTSVPTTVQDSYQQNVEESIEADNSLHNDFAPQQLPQLNQSQPNFGYPVDPSLLAYAHGNHVNLSQSLPSSFQPQSQTDFGTSTFGLPHLNGHMNGTNTNADPYGHAIFTGWPPSDVAQQDQNVQSQHQPSQSQRFQPQTNGNANQLQPDMRLW